jgi:hypothetical protein
LSRVGSFNGEMMKGVKVDLLLRPSEIRDYMDQSAVTN